MTEPAARLWTGRTVHVRERPFRRAFSYGVAMVEIDIDRLEDADATAHLFSVNSANAIAFHAKDHGQRTRSGSLRAWATERFAEAGVDAKSAEIRLISFPRVLGHGFAPISIWLASAQDGRLTGAIYEVRNTFGGAHAYVAELDGDHTVMTADKEFFVSPFFDVSGGYRFTLRKGEDSLEFTVENMSANGRDHVARLVVRPQALSNGAILRNLFAMPFSGLGVMFAIHWQAVRLWLKGARIYARLPAGENRTTQVTPNADPVVALEPPRKRA